MPGCLVLGCSCSQSLKSSEESRDPHKTQHTVQEQIEILFILFEGKGNIK
jgi:hypothetical protein